MIGYAIPDLNLQPHVATAAGALRVAFPDRIHFTSGRRDLQRQARVMAVNTAQNRQWIHQTYNRQGRPSYAIAQACQAAVNRLSETATIAQINAALWTVLSGRPDGTAISCHCAGLAFDFVPVPDHEVEIRALLHAQPGFDSFLTSEGGLLIYHVQFLPLATVSLA